MKTKTTPAPPQEGNKGRNKKEETVKPKRAKRSPKPQKELMQFDSAALAHQLEALQKSAVSDYRIVHRVIRRLDMEQPELVTWNRTDLLVLFEDHECILVKDEFGKGLLLQPCTCGYNKRGKCANPYHQMGPRKIAGTNRTMMDMVLEDTEYKDGIIYRTETVYSKNYNNIVGLFNDYLSKPK